MPLFDGLDRRELDEVATLLRLVTAHPRSGPPGPGRPRPPLAPHHRGHAVVQRDGIPIGLLGHGDSWAEHSLLNQLPSPITVVALSPLTLLTIQRTEFFAIPERHPVLAGRLVARSAVSPDRLAVPVFNALTRHAERTA